VAAAASSSFVICYRPFARTPSLEMRESEEMAYRTSPGEIVLPAYTTKSLQETAPLALFFCYG
jgi:hypothetical protein